MREERLLAFPSLNLHCCFCCSVFMCALFLSCFRVISCFVCEQSPLTLTLTLQLVHVIPEPSSHDFLLIAFGFFNRFTTTQLSVVLAPFQDTQVPVDESPNRTKCLSRSRHVLSGQVGWQRFLISRLLRLFTNNITHPCVLTSLHQYAYTAH